MNATANEIEAPLVFTDSAAEKVKTLIEEAWSPLVTRVQNMTAPADFEVAVDMEASRPELERAIIRELLERDARYRSAAEGWTQVALDVKRLALEDSTPEAVIDHLRRARAELVTSAGEPAPAMSKGGA